MVFIRYDRAHTLRDRGVEVRAFDNPIEPIARKIPQDVAGLYHLLFSDNISLPP
jgi:hypothetical protein